MKRNIEEVAQGVDESAKRPSAATKSGGQMTITGMMSASSSSILSSAIASYILTEGLNFSTVNSPYLKRVIEAAKHAPAGYRPPDRKDIAGKYLDECALVFDKKGDAIIAVVSADFGYSVMSDGAGVHGSPLLNGLIGIPNQLPVLQEVVDCTGHMAEGGKKDALFISNTILKYADKQARRRVKGPQHM